jgi:D-alanyl-D-alanine carboxypeptidase/D-alanyl-D-alanine-endopeptidase (penicillin-binding protein 4)
MKHFIIVIGYLLLFTGSFGQTVTQKLQKAYQQFESDSQLKHAISSLYVIDAKTGKVIFDKNSQIGLVPASTQKIITSVTAFELLGKNYRYKTELGYQGENKNGYFRGNFYLIGYGDPTLGSWRYKSTDEELLFENILFAVKKTGFTKTYKEELHSGFILVNGGFENDSYNDGWIWQDIGNYYGAMHNAINWRENQFDIIFDPGKNIGDPVEWGGFIPRYIYFDVTRNNLLTGPKGSGDNAYVYLNRLDRFLTVKGTLPAKEDNFRISAAHPNPSDFFSDYISNCIHKNSNDSVVELLNNITWSNVSAVPLQRKTIYTHLSPSFDSINYWFLKKSINLYGEALIKTFAYEKKGFGSTDTGVVIIKDFWKQKGIDEDELNITDGSGLSPLNRVTTHAQVEILKYAKTKDWFPYFYDALPEYNGMKIKSGTIRDVKGFCGYHKDKDGNEYIFSFLVNNYNGSASGVVNKMYKVLDMLK